MSNPSDQSTINDICTYANENEIKQMLQEYLKRVVIEQPEDPIKFLVSSISENPYVHTSQRGLPADATPPPESEPVASETAE